MEDQSFLKQRTAIALRSSIHTPSNILKLARMLDGSGIITSVFIPDIPSGFDSIEISAGALGCTQKLMAGSGVMRLLEYDEKQTLRRLEAIQALSENRFILGVGTGSPGRNPGEIIESLLRRLSSMKKHFSALDSSLELKPPLIYIATLKLGIARKVADQSDGILLNFCSPEYAKDLISHVGREGLDCGCYLKVFYSRNREIAERLLVEEFVKYDSLDQYHRMFELDGIVGAIKEAKENFASTSGTKKIPEPLLNISLANPSESELRDYVRRYREAGVTLPCIYPYFSTREDPRYIFETIGKINQTVAGPS